MMGRRGSPLSRSRLALNGQHRLVPACKGIKAATDGHDHSAALHKGAHIGKAAIAQNPCRRPPWDQNDVII